MLSLKKPLKCFSFQNGGVKPELDTGKNYGSAGWFEIILIVKVLLF